LLNLPFFFRKHLLLKKKGQSITISEPIWRQFPFQASTSFCLTRNNSRTYTPSDSLKFWSTLSSETMFRLPNCVRKVNLPLCLLNTVWSCMCYPGSPFLLTESTALKIILKWTLEKQGRKVWTGCIWHRVRTSDRLLWTR